MTDDELLVRQTAYYQEELNKIQPDYAPNRCDDCRKPYDGDPYYSFDTDACRWEEDGKVIIHDCTGSIGPCCADDLEPDNPNDPRRPT